MSRLTKSRTFWRFVLACILFVIGVIGGFAVLFWLDLTLAEREILLSLIHPHGIYIIGGGLLFAGVGLAIEWVYRMYVFPMARSPKKPVSCTA